MEVLFMWVVTSAVLPSIKVVLRPVEDEKKFWADSDAVMFTRTGTLISDSEGSF